MSENILNNFHHFIEENGCKISIFFLNLKNIYRISQCIDNILLVNLGITVVCQAEKIVLTVLLWGVALTGVVHLIVIFVI